MIYEWVKGIAGYLVVAGMILEAAGGSKYRKVIRISVGVIFVSILLAPVLKLGSIERINEDYDAAKYILDIFENVRCETEVRKYEFESRNVIEKAFKEEIAEDIEKMITGHNMIFADCEAGIDISGGKITYIKVKAFYDKGGEQIGTLLKDALVKELSKKYEIEEEYIIVYLESSVQGQTGK